MIFVIGISGSLGSGAFIGGGGQIVIDPVKIITDPVHFIGVQGVVNTGEEAAVKALLSAADYGHPVKVMILNTDMALMYRWALVLRVLLRKDMYRWLRQHRRSIHLNSFQMQ